MATTKRGLAMFIVERRNIRLSKGFFVAAIVLMLIAGAFGRILTKHVHYDPKIVDTREDLHRGGRIASPRRHSTAITVPSLRGLPIAMSFASP